MNNIYYHDCEIPDTFIPELGRKERFPEYTTEDLKRSYEREAVLKEQKSLTRFMEAIGSDKAHPTHVERKFDRIRHFKKQHDEFLLTLKNTKSINRRKSIKRSIYWIKFALTGRQIWLNKHSSPKLNNTIDKQAQIEHLIHNLGFPPHLAKSQLKGYKILSKDKRRARAAKIGNMRLAQRMMLDTLKKELT